MFIRHLRLQTGLALSLALASGLAMAAAPSTSASAAVAPPELPVSTFAKHATVSDPRLSPNGQYLLVSMTDAKGKDYSLVIFQLSDMKVVSRLRMPVYQLPLDPEWVSNDWIVLEIGKQYGSLDKPLNTGQVIATSRDGKKQRYLYGWHNEGGTRQSHNRGSDEGEGFIVGLPPVPNNHVYVRAEPFGRDNQSILYDIDVPSNSRHQLADLDVAGMSFMVGPDGKADYAFGNNANFDYVTYRQIDGRWVKQKHRQMGDYFEPLALTPDKQHLYAFVNPHGGPTQLVSEALDGSGRKVLASNKLASVGDIQWTAAPLRPFAVVPETGVPQPVYFNLNAPDAKLHRALRKAFPGKAVDFINFSQDGGTLLFFVSSDRDPGTYYLINTHTFKVRKLFAVAPWIKPAQMAQRVPITFKADDGLELSGILTFPQGRPHKDLPMVLMPHGGPYGIRDDWSFDWDAQFLANRGYLVLQVNYRGSGGRGVKFENAGFGKWGTRIQKDLTDGVKWAIAQHYADPKRICVYGGSFGGYSALMQVIRNPHLYQCTIGYAGVYDLAMLKKKGNIQSTDSGKSYLNAVLGSDPAVLAANSPDKLAAKIDVPVFLVHGKADNQAPYAEAEAMRAALQKAGKPFQWLAVDGEGHGFYTEKHRVQLLTQMQAFLAKYIGPGAPPTKH